MEPLQLIVDAFALGGVYVLAALGFVLVLNGIGAVNLAHRHLVTLAGFIARRPRRAGQDPELARALGIDTRRLAAATFALGTMLAGIAGLLLADRFTISPTFGLDLLVKSYVAVAIAGWGQVGAAAGVALAIALFETAVSTVAAPAIADAVVYVVLLVLLAFQPQGMFGPAAQRRA